MKSRFSDPLKKARRCQAECEEENYLSLVSRGCADPMSRPHFLPAHPHHDYSPAEKLKQVFSISCLKVHVRAIRQKGRDPHAGAAEEQNIRVLQPLLGTHPGSVPSQECGLRQVGRKGESPGAISRLFWDKTEVCTHPPAGALEPSGSTSSDTAYRNCAG